MGDINNYLNAHGSLDYNLTNDYLFKAVMQKNERALRGFICSLLNLNDEDIRSLLITNPIVLGEVISAKDFILDLELILNDDTLINLELQVADEKNWSERSLSYLCRRFDHLSVGEDYVNVKRTIHISILDFIPFPLYPEFYASYRLMNTKSHHIYSDKFAINVLSLKCIDLADEHNIDCGLVYWASLFKATTWEEIKMLAEKNDAIKEAISTLYDVSADEQVRLQCEARIRYERDVNTRRKLMEIAEQKLEEATQKYEETNKKLAENNKKLAENNKKLAENELTLQAKDVEIARLRQQLNELTSDDVNP